VAGPTGRQATPGGVTWNVVIATPERLTHPGLEEALFDGEEYVVVEAAHLPEMLVKVGVYGSFSEARRAGRDGPIPPGFTFPFRASKRVPEMAIWNCVVGASPEPVEEVLKGWTRSEQVFLETCLLSVEQLRWRLLATPLLGRPTTTT